MLSISLGVSIFWSALSLQGEVGEQLRDVGRGILINISIIGVLLAAGTGVLFITPEALASFLPWSTGITGLLIVGLLIGFSAPSADSSLAFTGRPGPSGDEHPPRFSPSAQGGLSDGKRGRPWLSSDWRRCCWGCCPCSPSRSSSVCSPWAACRCRSRWCCWSRPALAVGVFSFRLHLILEPAFQRHVHRRARKSPEDLRCQLSEGGRRSIRVGRTPPGAHRRRRRSSLVARSAGVPPAFVRPLIKSGTGHWRFLVRY